MKIKRNVVRKCRKLIKIVLNYFNYLVDLNNTKIFSNNFFFFFDSLMLDLSFFFLQFFKEEKEQPKFFVSF